MHQRRLSSPLSCNIVLDVLAHVVGQVGTERKSMPLRGCPQRPTTYFCESQEGGQVVCLAPECMARANRRHPNLHRITVAMTDSGPTEPLGPLRHRIDTCSTSGLLSNFTVSYTCNAVPPPSLLCFLKNKTRIVRDMYSIHFFVLPTPHTKSLHFFIRIRPIFL